MGRNNSYSLLEYRERQSHISKVAWQRRLANFPYKRETRLCARSKCGITFTTEPGDPKKYCSQSCAARMINQLRGKRSDETKRKISATLKGRPNPRRGSITVPRIRVICRNPDCNKKFLKERWRKKRFCSNICAMRVIGGQPTSPRASKGKGGIRKDISPTIYFYSRWEANMARLYSYLNIPWEYAPATFDIGGQKYTPDFYLPKTKTYVEVKNFWWKYSKERDEKFRALYPDIQLEVILKDDYLQMEKVYARLIPHWEYKNSKF